MRRIIYTFVVIVAVIVLAVVLWTHHGNGGINPTNSHKTESNKKSDQSQDESQETAPFHFNKHEYSISDPSSPWVVVNKQRPLQPKDYAPADLTPVGNGQYMRAAAAKALDKMLGDAKKAGYVVTPGSGYRSYSTQVAVYGSEVKAYGKKYADNESARPGYSEHQTGWAMDLSSGGCNITDCFANTPGGKWVTANAYKYGFVLRYPKGENAVTGYRYESWHFRYVGTYLSKEMHKENVMTLEQFFGLPAAPSYQ